MSSAFLVIALGPSLGKAPSIILWITTAIMIVAAIIIAAMTRTVNPRIRHHYYVSAFIVLWAATLYFLMASGYGYFTQPGGHVFLYARYIDWLVTTPLLLLSLALVALPKGHTGRGSLTAVLLGADVYMILTGFAASFIRTGFRWAFFGMSCAGFLVVLYIIAFKLTPEASRRSQDVKGLYAKLAPTLSILWICYPIVWVLSSTGWGVFPAFVSVLLFAILDIAAKVGYGFILVSHPQALTQAEQQTVETTGESRSALQA